ncbi:hypothetical protein YC2023_100714 [Brassica napus]
MALMTVVLKPDDAETEEIFGAAMARAAAAAALQSETHSVYHSPRRSSSFAGNSSPLPPSTVVSVANLCEMVKKLQRRTDPRVARLIESISDLNTLQEMALMAVVLKPDDAETEEIFGVAMARAAAAALQS